MRSDCWIEVKYRELIVAEMSLRGLRELGDQAMGRCTKLGPQK